MGDQVSQPEPGVLQVEKSPPNAACPQLESEHEVIERSLLWKIDLRLIPFLSFLYLLSFVDRANIGNAKIEGLVEDLNMSDRQYLWTLTAFFFPYALLETPSNMLLKRLRPSIWLPCITLAWGAVMTLMGFVKDFQGLLLCRLFLGVAEAGLIPGVTFYLSCWYKRHEYGRRIAVFFSAAVLSGAFGGFLAAAIARMDGVGGLTGWAWIFILEGLATIVAGLASFWIIADFPETAKFLSGKERAFVVTRLRADSQRSAGRAEPFSLSRVAAAACDWKTGFGMGIYMGVAGPVYGLALFTPSIIKELGHDSTTAQLLSVPPSVLACIVSITVGYLADRRGERARFNVLCLPVAIAGVLMNVVPSAEPGVRYAGIFLAAAGTSPCLGNTVAWVSNNVEGSYKRGIVMAMVISWGNIQGAVSSNVYRARDAPHYTLGHAVVLGYLVIALVLSLVHGLLLRAENRKRERGGREGRIRTGTEEEALELGDRHPRFRYII